MEDQAVASLVRRCVAGDAAAWEEIVRTYNRRIFNLCYRFTGSADDAEDLAQEVFIRVFRTLNSYEPSRGAFTTWVTTLTRNLLVDHFRKSKQERLTESLDVPAAAGEDSLALIERLADGRPGPEARVAGLDRQRLIQEALGKLSPELRETVILRDLEDMDYKDIARVLRVPEGTVKSRINRGRTELARLLARTYRQVV